MANELGGSQILRSSIAWLSAIGIFILAIITWGLALESRVRYIEATRFDGEDGFKIRQEQLELASKVETILYRIEGLSPAALLEKVGRIEQQIAAQNTKIDNLIRQLSLLTSDLRVLRGKFSSDYEE